jgi:hypothetical protein
VEIEKGDQLVTATYRTLLGTLFVAALFVAVPALAQTPDDQTPAEETSCDKYEGEGARHGLCIAYCEAQDCNGMRLDDNSCRKIESRFVSYSKKKGYLGGKPKPGRKLINCARTAPPPDGDGCSPEDRKFCGGKEQDCSVGGQCVAICSRTYEGHKGDIPVCSLIKCALCVPDGDCDVKGGCECPMDQICEVPKPAPEK